jgi:hypothetical protein
VSAVGTEGTTCSQISLAADEPLPGTATVAARWLLVEVRGAWGRDPLADTELPAGVAEALAAHDGRVTFVRRPDRREGATVLDITVDEQGGASRRVELPSVADVAGLDLAGAAPVDGPFVLVCGHGRRDACCARLGRRAFDALLPHLPHDRLWQSSHLGGHRFAPNVVVLPSGVQLGRIPPDRAEEVAAAALQGRIPLDLYRGRVIYSPHVQAAEVAVRVATGCDRVDDARFVGEEGEHVTFSTPAGERTVRVELREGPRVPASCGAEPEPTTVWEAELLPATR